MSEDLNLLKQALRDLVGSIHIECKGAYGGEYYEGQYESEINRLAEIIIRLNLEEKK